MNGDQAETPKREMPRYQCHKQVHALKIKDIRQAPADQEKQHVDGDWLLIPEDASYSPICVGHTEYLARHNPQAGGYYVVYDDGYTSYSPAKAFEEGYSLAAAASEQVAYNSRAVERVTETELAAKAVAPRVTPADIEANIASEHYFTAADAYVGSSVYEKDVARSQCPPALGLLTLCVLVLRNGFTVVGESACASPDNFNAEIGRRIARENAIAKVWTLMGYALKDRLTLPVKEA